MPVIFELALDVDAPPERVWEVLMDVERWHEWTPSIRSIARRTSGPLALGSAVRIRQPGLLPATWRVTELAAGERFTWSSWSPGARSTASHVLERRGAGARITHAVRIEGALVWLLRPWLAGVAARYVTLEANGLKARCERT